jgi:PAS domain S-box-containing protein
MLELAPQRATEVNTDLEFMSGPGEMAAKMRAFDWASSELGPAAAWPQSLKTAVRIMLASRYAMWMAWGPNLTFFCNDAYLPTVGLRREWVLGSQSKKVWSEIWPDIGPRIDRVLTTGEATWDEALLLFLERLGFSEETYHTFSYSPLADDHGHISGMLCVVTEETERVVGERRLASLSRIATGLAAARAELEVLDAIKVGLDSANKDIGFAALYLSSGDGPMVLTRVSGIDTDHPAVPAIITPGGPWPNATTSSKSFIVDNLEERFRVPLPLGAWNKPPNKAVVVPIASQGQEKPVGCLIAGLNPHRTYDTKYSDFIELLTGQVSAGLASARVFESERRRADALAEIDRAKTLFFSNVSHEFRTPLTLMLGPIEDAINDASSSALNEVQRERLNVAYRNSQRLLKLVNTLLDFSRIEAGRIKANFQPTDLSAFTAELASNFRSATERAGLRLKVVCEPLAQEVYVDRDLWEKVVFNLLSNAFKFTFTGIITVETRPSKDRRFAEFIVSDTGVGIPAHELPRLFERFHRVENQKSRSFEGSGIGLALVQELVKLHGASITVESETGKGTVFKIDIPFGTQHIPSDRIGTSPTGVSTTLRANAFVEEVLSWLPENKSENDISKLERDVAISELIGPESVQGRILVADDNADMRGYIGRLLRAQWDVELVENGQSALEALWKTKPDLVVADAMMPGLDGFGLVQAIRNDGTLSDIPVIMLSARAGEEARIEGLAAGADYYLTKPFSARELVAQVHANLMLARVRREANECLRKSEEALRLRAAQYETLLNEAPLGVYVVDAEFRILSVNPTALAAFGDTSGLIGRDFEEFIHVLWPAHYADEIVRLFKHTLKTGEPYFDPEHIEERLDRSVTEYYEWQIHRIPLPEGGYGVVCYFRDISAQVRAARQRELLINELNHRVKNTLATIQSITAQTLKGAKVPPSVNEVLEARLLSLAGAHDVLTQQNWEGAHLRNIVVKALSPFVASGRDFEIEGPDVKLHPKSTLAITMALHELATNAVKYGALSTRSGRASVQWTISTDRGESYLNITWTEAGGPLVTSPTRKGFGSRLIERGLAGELGGEARIDYRETGVICSIRAPMTGITGSSSPMLLNH